MNPEKNSKRCAHPQCLRDGLYRAPASTAEPTNYHWFCLEHVREYNAKWNYFGNLSAAEIEQEIRRATVWERKTWPFGKGPVAHRKQPSAPRTLPRAVRLALKEMKLDESCSFKEIKAKYRELAKRFHPDASKGPKNGIENFLRLQQAFGTLQKFYATKNKEHHE